LRNKNVLPWGGGGGHGSDEEGRVSNPNIDIYGDNPKTVLDDCGSAGGYYRSRFLIGGGSGLFSEKSLKLPTEKSLKDWRRGFEGLLQMSLWWTKKKQLASIVANEEREERPVSS